MLTTEVQALEVKENLFFFGGFEVSFLQEVAEDMKVEIGDCDETLSRIQVTWKGVPGSFDF